MSAVWPELPAVGELVGLPLALPPMLCDAAGRHSGGRYVAFYWTPYGDELVYTDGAVGGCGHWPAWLALTEHDLGRAMLGPYELGSSDSEAEHWLLADRLEGTLHVGLPHDVRQLLQTQPSELDALADAIGAERVRELLERQLQDRMELTSAEIQARIERDRQLVARLTACLDDVLAATMPGGER